MDYRRHRRYAQIPGPSKTMIIAFTALDEKDVRQRMVNEEIDAYCQKGHATTHLMRLIETLTS